MDKMMTPNEVAEILGVPEKTLSQWRYVRTGPPFYKVGRHVRYKQPDVAAWLQGQASTARHAA